MDIFVKLVLFNILADIFLMMAIGAIPHFATQAREKFLSLRKSTRMDVAAAIEEVYTILTLS